MASLFYDGPEYKKRMETPFKPTKVTLSEVHSVVPKHLHERNTFKALLYVARDVICAVIVYKLGWLIDPAARSLVQDYGFSQGVGTAVKWGLWAFYWHWQGVILAGWWCLAHEAGHGSLSNHSWLNHLLGFSLHTFILVPYYAWRSTHNAHHKATMSIERDENFVPRTRSDYGLPPESSAHISDYHDIFEETPIYTLLRMLFMQALGWQFYLFTNAMGSPMYPAGTNHFQPSSPLFKPHERKGIIASNIGLTFMSCVLYMWTKEVGLHNFAKLYLVPYILANHWIVMLTYLHHSDPTIAHYRKKEWSFLRGAISTVDRPLLGWAGRFFLHNVSHDHVAHHLFSSIPFYNQPKVTEAIKKVLKEDYNFDSTNTFRALYRTFTQCCFIEDDGDIVFYKNQHGKASRVLAEGVLGETKKST
ncbi:Acyl-lipid omega-3 desaturase (cytochrome b5), endoplasmic reticulum [Hypsizygus marmoreus]|uniref:Acyl-lipid omega-3 desaturase (Cytochrome b5), endoplasmic reticulum n=1 Tax=Hypsizygus marmoreus TaxID=39966 RepID=A0A369JJQ6_HYPMA|nr:Acyl-lipid omega-3 desaturase (cytochrome b5), endoplasmic reticulum [Hypsizygus marmoreus]